MWVAHLQREGYTVTTHEVSDPQLEAVKTHYEVPDRLRTCHTAIVDGYLVEGHVPAASVRRMLKERPAIAGIGVPGMPIGSPGMAGPNPEPYAIYAFDREGRISLYERIEP